MKRIGFTGVPGSGKSSVARALTAVGHPKLRKVELVAEYARRFITKYGPVESPADQYKIMQKQIEWEDVIPSDKTDVIITESPVHMGFLYALEIRDPNKIKDTMYMNDIFKRLNTINCPNRYDIIFHLPPTWKPQDDGVRDKSHFSDEWREESDQRIQFIFKLFPPKRFVKIQSDTMETRLKECAQWIDKI